MSGDDWDPDRDEGRTFIDDIDKIRCRMERGTSPQYFGDLAPYSDQARKGLIKVPTYLPLLLTSIRDIDPLLGISRKS